MNKMALCRTCLSKKDLRPIFPDKDLVSLRSRQLNLACGIKVEPNDGLTQLICVTCLNLINEALKLRKQSLKAEETLKKSLLTTIKIESDDSDSPISPQRDHSFKNDNKNNINKKEPLNLKMEQQKSKILINKTKKVGIKKFNMNIDSKNIEITDQINDSVHIEDFESSNDSDFNMSVDDVKSIQSDYDSCEVCIEDFESSDSMEDLKEGRNEKEREWKREKESKEYNKVWDLKAKELLERGRKKLISKEHDQKLLSLAVAPYETWGPIRCTLCNKVMSNLANFKSHAKTHFELQNACEECGKKFVNPCHLRYHQQRVHGRKKRLACSTCAYRAVDALQLQNHVRAEHTGERPYICDVCGDSFRMRANIAQHMRKHFGVRNLQCERCPAMFRSRAELTGHQNRVHYLIYTYLCYLCPETYKRPESVKKHLVNVHGVPRNQQLPIKCIKTRKINCEKSD